MRIAAPGPSSRLHAPVAGLLADLFPGLARQHSRALWHSAAGDSLVLCRGFDVPQLVASGFADIGICGYDVGVEWSLRHGRPLFMWALPEVRTSFVTYCTVSGREVSTIYTEYPAITEAWTRSTSQLRDVRVVTLHGSTEGVIRSDPAGAGVLLVTSGDTLRANGLDHDVPLLATDVCVVSRTPDVTDPRLIDVAALLDVGMPSFGKLAANGAGRRG
ncbi:hypothetical protein ACPFP2_01560 [Micromonospora citrea]|uniref:hypothetical protein n=1 Tax=Micromonospora citrea TaxID=47855 RepID=UPI003C3B0974